MIRWTRYYSPNTKFSWWMFALSVFERAGMLVSVAAAGLLPFLIMAIYRGKSFAESRLFTAISLLLMIAMAASRISLHVMAIRSREVVRQIHVMRSVLITKLASEESAEVKKVIVGNLTILDDYETYFVEWSASPLRKKAEFFEKVQTSEASAVAMSPA